MSCKFVPRTAFAVPRGFGWVTCALFCLRVLLFYLCFLLADWFSSMLFTLYVFLIIPVFSVKLLSSLIPLWPEKMLDTISVFLSLL